MKNRFLVSLLVVGFVCLCLSPFISPRVEAFGAWSNYKTITVDHTKVTGNLCGFPMLIDLTTDASLAAVAQADGDDIFFTNESGAVVFPHEIELYTSVTGRLLAWVNVSRLSNTSDTVLRMYYGNASCGSQQNVNGTWDANYLMVQHMKDATTSTILDSTRNNNDGAKKAANEPNQVSGKIGNAQDFDGSNDKIIVSNFNNLATLTVSAFIKMDADTGWIMNKRNNALDNQWQLVHSGGFLGISLFLGNSTVVGNVPNGASCLGGAYHHVVFTTTGVTGGSLILYKNGGVTGTPATLTGNMKLGARDLVIGMSAWIDWVTGAFDGIIDEVRISNIARNASWIATEYANMNSPGTFYEVGNSPPIITLVSPADGSINNTLKFQVVITVTDPDLDSFDITWYNNHSSGGYIDYQLNLTCTDGTFRYVLNESEDCNTKYWCKVMASDGSDNMTVIYTFTTMTDYWWGLECSGGGSGGSFVNSNGGRIGIIGLCGVLGLVFCFIGGRKRKDK